MANVEQTNGALDVSQAINKQIATKIKYLQELETAVINSLLLNRE